MPNFLIFQEPDVHQNNANIEILGHRIRRRRHLRSHDHRLTSSLNDINKVHHNVSPYDHNGILSTIDFRRRHEQNNFEDIEHESNVPGILPGRVRKSMQVDAKSSGTLSHNRLPPGKNNLERSKFQQTFHSFSDNDNLQATFANEKEHVFKVNRDNNSEKATQVPEIKENSSVIGDAARETVGGDPRCSAKSELPNYESLVNGLTLARRSFSPNIYSRLRRLSVLQGHHALSSPHASSTKLSGSMEGPWSKSRLPSLEYPFKIQTPMLDINNLGEKQGYITTPNRVKGVHETDEFGHDLLNFHMSNRYFSNCRKLTVGCNDKIPKVPPTKPHYVHRPGFPADHVSHPIDLVVGKIIQRRHRYFQGNGLQVLGSESHGSSIVHHQNSDHGPKKLESSCKRDEDDVPTSVSCILGGESKVEARETSIPSNMIGVSSTNIQKSNTSANSVLQDSKTNNNESTYASHDLRPFPNGNTTETSRVKHSTRGQTSSFTSQSHGTSGLTSSESTSALLDNTNGEINNTQNLRQVDNNDKKRDHLDNSKSETKQCLKSKIKSPIEDAQENSFPNSHSHSKTEGISGRLENIGINNKNDSFLHTSISHNNSQEQIQPGASVNAIKNAKSSGAAFEIDAQKLNEKIVKTSTSNPDCQVVPPESDSNTLDLPHVFKQPTNKDIEGVTKETQGFGLMSLPSIKDKNFDEKKAVKTMPQKDTYSAPTHLSSKRNESRLNSFPTAQFPKSISVPAETTSGLADDKKLDLTKSVSINPRNQESKDKKQDWIIVRDYISTHLGGYGSKYNVWTNNAPMSDCRRLVERKQRSHDDLVSNSNIAWQYKDIRMPQDCMSSIDKDDNNNSKIKTNRSNSQLRNRNGLVASIDTKTTSRLTWKLAELASRRSHQYQQAKEALGAKDAKQSSRPVSREKSPRHVGLVNIDLRPSSRGALLRSLGQKNSVPFRIRSADLQGSAENPKHIDIVQKCHTFNRAVDVSKKGISGKGLDLNGSDQNPKAPMSKKEAAEFIYNVDKLHEKQAESSSAQSREPDPQTQELLDYFWSYQGMGRQILRADSGNVSPFRGTQFWKSQAVATLAGNEQLIPFENANSPGPGFAAGVNNFSRSVKYRETDYSVYKDKKKLSDNELLERDGAKEKRKVRLVVKMPLTESDMED